MPDSSQLNQDPQAAVQVAPAPEPPAQEASANLRPIIRKKIIEEGHAGAHGGAWKIALADMMTAMMAFFLLMWLLGATNEDQRKSIADYFRPSSHSQIVFGELAGSNGLFGGQSIVDPNGFPYTAKQSALFERLTPRAQGGPAEGKGENKEDSEAASGDEASEMLTKAQKEDRENFQSLERELKRKFSENKEFKKMEESVSIVREKDGLRIEIVDRADFSMFRLGTSELDPRAVELLSEVAKLLGSMPNKVTVRGHTDSLGFPPDSIRNNWTLSTERADATRQILQGRGVTVARFARIEGVADTVPFIPSNPADPRNRRVSITVLNQ